MADKRSPNERIKENSQYLRGTIEEGLGEAVTGAIADDDTQLLKFHGSYMQDDRDIRAERGKKKLEKAYSFMIRLRLPGGVVSPAQWLKLDEIAEHQANGTLRLTTRATFQYHGIIKSNLKRAMQAINASCLDTIAACGDVNRNVISSANPFLSKAHAATADLARDISNHLLPQTSAYHEIWLDGEKVVDGGGAAKKDSEPLYGEHYLPRKFKIVLIVPPDNEADIYAHDLGYIAIVKDGKVIGYNVTVGGGMGMTHGDEETFPRAADVMGFCTPDQAVAVAEHVMTTQRDWGNRENRKRARLKYTIEDRGLDAFRKEVEKRLGAKFGKPKPFTLTHTGDHLGWRQGDDKKWHLTLFIENGRIKDAGGVQLRTALREIANLGTVDFVLTGNQNLVLANIAAKSKNKIEKILKDHGLSLDVSSAMRGHSMACVALPTCGLALAESERSLPGLITRLEETVEQSGLRDDAIVVRMTGCPNGCARPYLAEIGFVGRNLGVYNLYLGAAFNGSRLSKLYAQDVTEDQALDLLRPLIARYAKEREDGEHFGDFVIRAGVVKETAAGNQFHKDINLADV